ncbi:MAG: gliding motility-associated C-terminal domain-containing protein [Cytophagaceae bacterium]|nr:gliding motility-associated C-terminal domain-containing protein [Cytophagaceae bacterium]MBL0301555.1 gliding motility-associated C-terminal domain-containing protein [Cytophagaceae bacterium]MBL0324378.1 gliding motility-associated C-terminal domain-containing protein [Cytophagaceae bacterium]
MFKKCPKYYFLTFLLLAGMVEGFAQFYVGKACVIADPAAQPVSGQSTCYPMTDFFDLDRSSVLSEWDFGDGNLMTGRSVYNGFTMPGNYMVNLRKTYADGTISNYSENVIVGTFPQQPMFNDKLETDTTVCEDVKLKLDPFKGFSPGNISYLWFPGGETTSTLEVTENGCYSVEVKDNVSGCSRSARIKVKFCLKESQQQQGSEKWYFGDGGSLEFSFYADSTLQDSLETDGSLSPEPDYTEPGYNPSENNPASPINSNEAVAMVFDQSTNMVLYTDGKKIYSGLDDTEIPNQDGSTFALNLPQTSQGLLIMPKGSCNSCKFDQYYVYYVNPTDQTLYYSIVDMRYNNKKGAVTESNIPLLYPVSEKMVGFRTQDDSTYAFFSYDQKKDKINTVRISDTGFTITETGLGIGASPESASGYISISENQRKIAFGYVNGGRNHVLIYDVNPGTLALSNPVDVDLGINSPPQVYGLAFSSTGNILYVTLKGDLTNGTPSYLYQLPILGNDAAQINAQKILISQSTSDLFGALMLGPVLEPGTKYLYMSIEGKNYVAYIQDPDEIGNANTIGFSLRPGSAEPGAEIDGTAKLGFPNIVGAAKEQDGEGLSANYSGNCQNSPTILTSQGICSPMKNEYTWFLADGTKLSGQNVSHVFTEPGWQEVKLVVKVINESKIKVPGVGGQLVDQITETDCKEIEYNGRFYIKPAPITNFRDPIFICMNQGETERVNANATGGNTFSYRWMTSQSTFLSSASYRDFNIANSDPNDPLIYKIEVVNDYGCTSLRDFKVLPGCDPILFIPEVFTPNGDNFNPDFEISIDNYSDYDLKIYNRWGEIVFESKDPNEKWDGKVRGKIYGNQLYPYVLNYRPKYDIAGKILTKKGTVIVLK